MPPSLPPELQHFVEQELASERYQTPEEVICDALRLLRQRKLHQLRTEIDAGVEQLDRDEGIEIKDEQSLRAFFDEIKAQGRERLEAHESGR